MQLAKQFAEDVQGRSHDTIPSGDWSGRANHHGEQGKEKNRTKGIAQRAEETRSRHTKSGGGNQHGRLVCMVHSCRTLRAERWNAISLGRTTSGRNLY